MNQNVTADLAQQPGRKGLPFATDPSPCTTFHTLTQWPRLNVVQQY